MNDPRRVELKSSIGARSAPVSVGRKVAMGLLAVSMILVMIVWIGFLGWGMVALVRWL